MGTGPFAVPSADGLLTDGYDVPLVVTRPALGLAHKKAPIRPMADWAVANKISLFEPASINTAEAIEVLRGYKADIFFVCDYGQILSKSCLTATRLGGINLHGSILPRHRGAAPVQWSLLTGDTQAGVTVILMTPKLDAGPALTMQTTQILPDEVAGQLEPRLALLGGQATREALRQLSSWDGVSSIGSIQDNSQSTKAPRFEKQHGQLDLRLPAEYLVRLIRACQPWPGTFVDLQLSNPKQLRLLVRSARSMSLEPNKIQHVFGPTQQVGAIAAVSCRDLGLDWQNAWSDLLAAHTPDGTLLINRVQPAGKKEMSVAEFVRGHPFGEGTCFLLPPQPCIRLTN